MHDPLRRRLLVGQPDRRPVIVQRRRRRRLARCLLEGEQETAGRERPEDRGGDACPGLDLGRARRARERVEEGEHFTAPAHPAEPSGALLRVEPRRRVGELDPPPPLPARATGRTKPRSSRPRSRSSRSSTARSVTRTDSPEARRSRISRSPPAALASAPRSVMRYRTAPAAGRRDGSALFNTSPVEAKNRSATRAAVARSSGGHAGSRSSTSRTSRRVASESGGAGPVTTPVSARSPKGTRTRHPGAGAAIPSGTR